MENRPRVPVFTESGPFPVAWIHLFHLPSETRPSGNGGVRSSPREEEHDHVSSLQHVRPA